MSLEVQNETPTSDAAWTVGRILTWSTGFLAGKTDSPRLDAEILLAHALGFQRIQLYTQFDKPLYASEREPFKGFLKRRAGGEPVAYIVGRKEFMGLTFNVTPAVLIPRPDTEVLVETAMAWGKGHAGLSILDVGTGSGCIAISLAHKLTDAVVTAWDISDDALTIARDNAATNAAAVTFERRDALDLENWVADAASDEPGGHAFGAGHAAGDEPGGHAAGAARFSLIVSNPPYIAPGEAPALPKSVVAYEPKLALFAAPDGLQFYRLLATHAHKRLAPQGKLMVEIGHQQASAVSGLLQAAGWQDVAVIKDYGKNDRVITASRPDVR